MIIHRPQSERLLLNKSDVLQSQVISNFFYQRLRILHKQAFHVERTIMWLWGWIHGLLGLMRVRATLRQYPISDALSVGCISRGTLFVVP